MIYLKINFAEIGSDLKYAYHKDVNHTQHVSRLLQYFCFCYHCMFSVSTKLVNFLFKVIPMFVSWFAGIWYRLDSLVLRNKWTVSMTL